MRNEIDHRTCTYCKYNENSNRLSSNVVCNLKGNECNFWERNKFESVDDHEIDQIDSTIQKKEDSEKSYRIGSTIATCYFLAVITCGLVLGIHGLYLRFTNPLLTETQLFLLCLHKQAGLTIVFLVLLLLPKILKLFSK